MKPVEAQIEAFLAEISANLSALPEERREEILVETRGHLQAMMAARRADGMDEAVAWESTRRNFGDPSQIGGALATEWKRAPRFETLGRPLTLGEKLEKVMSSSGNALAFGLIFVLLKPWLEANHLVYLFLIAEIIRGAAFRTWRLHRSGESFKPAALLTLLLPLVLVGGLVLHTQLRTLLPFGMAKDLFGEWFAPSFIAFFLALLMWSKIREKDVRPWRKLPLFATNPVGAEELYRTMPWAGALTGLLLGLLLSLSTGEKFLLLKFLPWIFAVLVTRVIYRRWMAKRAF